MSCRVCPVDTVPLDDFIPYIAPYIRGAPDAIMAHMAREATIELSRRALPVKRTLFVDLQANVNDYCVTPDDPCCTIIAVIRAAQAMDTSLSSRWPLTARQDYPLNNYCVGREFYLESLTTMHVWPVPACDIPDGLEVTVHVSPSQDCCFVDKFLYDHYAETIADGALYRLFLMKGSNWYDEGLARVFLQKHLSGVGRAKTEAMRNRTSGPQVLKARRWV